MVTSLTTLSSASASPKPASFTSLTTVRKVSHAIVSTMSADIRHDRHHNHATSEAQHQIVVLCAVNWYICGVSQQAPSAESATGTFAFTNAFSVCGISAEWEFVRLTGKNSISNAGFYFPLSGSGVTPLWNDSLSGNMLFIIHWARKWVNDMLYLGGVIWLTA